MRQVISHRTLLSNSLLNSVTSYKQEPLASSLEKAMTTQLEVRIATNKRGSAVASKTPACPGHTHVNTSPNTFSFSNFSCEEFSSTFSTASMCSCFSAKFSVRESKFPCMSKMAAESIFLRVAKTVSAFRHFRVMVVGWWVGGRFGGLVGWSAGLMRVYRVRCFDV